jgi:hypothetical protein
MRSIRPGDPALALHEATDAVSGQGEINVSVRALAPALLVHLPAIASEQLADHPFEFLAVQEPQIRRPLHQMPAVRCLNLGGEPEHRETAGEHCGDEVDADEPHDRQA